MTFPAGVTSWKALRIGGSISCGIGNTDWVYCWGSGLYGDTGQWGYGTWPAGVGNNSSAGSLTPVAVTSPGGGVTSFSQIAVGISAACAIANDNKVYCWGANERGSIGNSTSTGVGSAPALRPTLVTMPAGVTSFSKIVSGQDYFCALSNTNRAYCWGQNYFGQVGDGSGGGAYSGVWDEYVNRPSLMQLPVSSATSVVDISASRWGACITGNDYKRYCTGDNFMGQIGDGNMWVNVAIKVPTAHARGDTIVAMDDGGVGAFRSTYYIDNLNQLWTGGLNQYGEMGNGTTNGTNPNATFYKVPYPPGITKWNRVMGGGEAVCAQGS
ncbi:MAG: RCC1 domain-containing protein [Rickettsiales bacterium]